VTSLIISVSDVHLGYENSNKDDFDRFITSELAKLGSSDHLVLLGDIMEFWRRNNVSVALENQDTLNKLQALNTNVYYVVGNHDYLILDWANRYAPFYPFKVSKFLRLSDGGREFYFMHGYELEVLSNLEPMTIEAYEKASEWLCQMTEAFFGSILSRIWGTVQVAFKRGDKRLRMARAIVKMPHQREDMDKIDQLAVSDVKRLFLGIKKDESLVFGHTHRPFLKANVANTGSWVSDADECNTFLVIRDGVMDLKKF